MSGPQPQKPAPPPVIRPAPPVVPPPTISIKSALPARDPEKVQLEAVIRLAYAASLRADSNSESIQSGAVEDIVDKFIKTRKPEERMAIICQELEKHGFNKLEINSARSKLAGMSPSVPEVILNLSKKALEAHAKLNVDDERATAEQKDLINRNPDYWNVWKDGEFPKAALDFK